LALKAIVRRLGNAERLACKVGEMRKFDLTGLSLAELRLLRDGLDGLCRLDTMDPKIRMVLTKLQSCSVLP